MPSLQTVLPPELANNVIRLYRECLRRAKYIGQRQHNTELLVDMVRQQFKKNMLETDPEKIQKLKDDWIEVPDVLKLINKHSFLYCFFDDKSVFKSLIFVSFV
ncbi:uncharacterized protein LOC132179800 isoform X1 [Corylus avellana]|uniref:uncharacterized protein LOC132179800 isoform X1 n=1 Tax=Corylus avellana TaxID=13451 RepID=UPI00286A69B9|nr:uncharacterized protein LOC132179800 isoform X1 [Corylus avellana]XP_059448573.1 uncharacterized protein LOC132179800 isoform X1 [Corylus avellana]